MAINLGNPVLFLLSLFLEVAFAQQSTTVTLIDRGGYESLAASVVAVDATATTYQVRCVSKTAGDCQFDGPDPTQIVFNGPSIAVEQVPPILMSNMNIVAP
jgi:hypothetical protein